MQKGIFVTTVAAAIVAASFVARGSAATLTITTYAAKPSVIHLGSAPRCTALAYKLSVPARDVDLKIADSRGHEVWEVERKTSGVAAGVVHRFTWCGRVRGGTAAVGTYLWRIEAEQAGSHVEVRSYVGRIGVRR